MSAPFGFGVGRGARRHIGSGSAPLPAFLQTPYLAGALTDIAANVRDGLFVTVGDSTTMGRGAGSGGIGTAGARALAIPAKMAEQLAALGIAVSTDAFFGFAGVTSTPPGTEYSAYYTAADPLTGSVAINGATNTWNAGGNTLGGALIGKTSSSANTLVFTPKLSCRWFEIWIAVTGATGGFSFSIDGGAAQTYNNADFSLTNIHKIMLDAGSEGAHSLSINSIDASTVYLCGVIARSQTRRLIVVNAGWRASATADWIAGLSNPWAPLNMLVALHPDAIDYSLGINDIVADVALATYQANTAQIVSAVSGFADVFIRLPNDISSSAGNDDGPVYLAAYQDWLRSYAASASFNLIDTPALIGNYATVSAAGNMYDALHPRAAPYAILGAAEANLVHAAGTGSTLLPQSLSGVPTIALVGQAYSWQPALAGGAGARAWSVDGSGDTLPAGLTLNSATGAVTGTPTAQQARGNVVIKAVDATGTASHGYAFRVADGGYDSFAGTSGTNITAHAADSGETWTASASAVWLISSTGTLYLSARSATNNLAYFSHAVSGAQFAQADLIFKTAGANQQLGVCVNIGADTGYWFGWRFSTQKWEINKQASAGGAWTTLASSADIYAPQLGDARTIRLENDGAGNLKGYVGDVLVAQTATPDTTYTGGGTGVGSRVTNVGSDTTGPHLDNFRGGDLP